MKLSKSYTPVRVVFVILSVVIMVMIFMFSCEDSDKSSDTSGTITEFVAEHVVKDFDQLPITEKEDIFSKIQINAVQRTNKNKAAQRRHARLLRAPTLGQASAHRPGIHTSQGARAACKGLRTTFGHKSIKMSLAL